MWLLVNVTAEDCDDIRQHTLKSFETKDELDNHIKAELLRLIDTAVSVESYSYCDYKDSTTNKHLTGKDEVEKRIQSISNWSELVDKPIIYTFKELCNTEVVVNYRPNSVQFLNGSNYYSVYDNFVFIEVSAIEEQFITVKTVAKVYESGGIRNSTVHTAKTLNDSREWFYQDLMPHIKEFTKSVNTVLAPVRKNYSDMLLNVSLTGNTLTIHDDHKFTPIRYSDTCGDNELWLDINSPMTNISTYVIPGFFQDRHCTTNYILLRLSHH